MDTNSISDDFSALTCVYATYEDPNHIWPVFAEEFRTKLPLKKVLPASATTGSSTSGAPTRFSRSLADINIEFKPYSTFTCNPSSSRTSLLLPSSAYTPYFHLLLITCEDFDTYKGSVKKTIADWVESVHLRKNQQTVLLYVTNSLALISEQSKNASSLFSIKSSVFDKIKTDFGTNKQNRFALLRLRDKSEGPVGWNECLECFGDALYTGFVSFAMGLEDDIRRLDAQRLLPGWNYFNFFLTKESLAFAYEGVGLNEEALIQYDELEAVFMEVLDKSGYNLLWMSKLGGTEKDDDIGNILDFKRKPFRSLIQQSAISLFDFVIYLFARQCHLLFKLHRPLDVLQRGKLFICNFCYLPLEHRKTLPDLFQSRWSFCATSQLLSQCEQLISGTESLPLDTQKALILAKAEIAFLARQQLDKIGPNYFPSYSRRNSLALAPQSSTDAPIQVMQSPLQPSNSPLIESFSLNSAQEDFAELVTNPKKFDQVYQRLTKYAIEGYSLWQHRRTVNFLTDEFFGRYQLALELLETLIKENPDLARWYPISQSILKKIAKCYNGLTDYQRYITVCLDILRLGINNNKSHLVKSYLQEVINTSVCISEPFEITAAPFFAVHGAEATKVNEISLQLDWKIPENLPLGRIKFDLFYESHTRSFESTSACLTPGIHSYTLYTEERLVGTFIPVKLSFFLGKIEFIAKIEGLVPITFRQKDHALSISSSFSKHVNLAQPTIDLIVLSKTDALTSPKLYFLSHSAALTIDKESIVCGFFAASMGKYESEYIDSDQSEPLAIPIKATEKNELYLQLPSIDANRPFIVQMPINSPLKQSDNIKIALIYGLANQSIGKERIEEDIIIPVPPHSWDHEFQEYLVNGCKFATLNIHSPPSNRGAFIISKLITGIDSTLAEQEWDDKKFILEYTHRPKKPVLVIKGTLSIRKSDQQEMGIQVGDFIKANVSYTLEESKVPADVLGEETIFFTVVDPAGSWFISGKVVEKICFGKENMKPKNLVLYLVPLKPGIVTLPILQHRLLGDESSAGFNVFFDCPTNGQTIIVSQRKERDFAGTHGIWSFVSLREYFDQCPSVNQAESVVLDKQA